MRVGKFPQGVGALALAAFLTAGAFFAAARADYADGNYALNHISLETAVRLWRKAAWQENDFLSQVKLGDVYANASDNRYYDPVEAYVWYYIAGRNRAARGGYWRGPGADVIGARRYHALTDQYSILLQLSNSERAEAHDRIVYILACRGADGFLELGRISTTESNRGRGDDDDDDYGYDRGRDRGGRGSRIVSVMQPNDSEALTFFHLADSMGHPMGGPFLSLLERRMRSSWIGGRIVDKQAKAFHHWTPPFEFYPTGSSPGGVPLTDECVPHIERQRALALSPAIPQDAVRHALYFLGWKGRDAVAQYQASLPDETTGRLTAQQLVRAIQTAAVNGDAASQNTLGVMYAKGLGVVTNYVRAEYWFAKAADQRYAAALYHLAILYKAGPPGIAQDLHKSNDYMTSSALAGFRPTMNQLGALLNAAANEAPRPGQN
ncbi:MAG TPA: tetratricopeptide repeat protein [Rhizomicrobium sp.]